MLDTLSFTLGIAVGAGIVGAGLAFMNSWRNKPAKIPRKRFKKKSKTDGEE